MEKTRKEACKEKQKEKIFKAAVHCVNEKGYYETTIDDIAEQVRVSKGLIYYYFDSKKDLFLVTDFDELDRQPALKELLKKYPVLESGDGYTIHDLGALD